MKKLILILICGQLVFSCDKDELSGSCETLRDAVLHNNIDKARSAINSFINRLESKVYNEPNLTVLVEKISSQCNVSSTIMCFNCVRTLPSQTEIRIVITSGGTTVSKTIDISYSANNIITFVYMHD
jgi:uncharacterized membrane-anchored protein YjiN (DUF445 family)